MKINEKCKINEKDLFYHKNPGILYRIRRWFFNSFQKKRRIRKRNLNYSKMVSIKTYIENYQKEGLSEKILKELEKNVGKK